MFADVKGYSTLVEKLDPEWVGDLVDRLWGELGRIVVENGGRVVQHLGDGVLALWGGEHSDEDDAEKAVRAALSMLEAMQTFESDRVRAGTLQLRVGINTGLVHLGHVGVTEEFRATGDTVNVASRLESNAEPGTVLISRTTYNQVRGVFDVSHVGDLELKGRDEPVGAYRVDTLRPRAFRVRARGFEGLETRMVGRGRHLSRVVDAHRATTQTGDSSILVVSGEPGIGKSRLLYEYRDWIETESTIRVALVRGPVRARHRRAPARAPPRPVREPLRDLGRRRSRRGRTEARDGVRRPRRRRPASPATLGWLLGLAANVGEEDRQGLQVRRKLALDDLVGRSASSVPRCRP